MVDYLGHVIHKDLKRTRKSSYQMDKINSRITPSFRKSSFDEIENRFKKIEFKVIFIGISGGQASGKKRIVEYLKNHIHASAIISETNFFKVGEKERKISKEDEYLLKDYDFYNKERRLYLIDKCNPDNYDYDKFYETLINLREGKRVKIPYFDEEDYKYKHEKDKIIDPEATPLIIIDGYFIFKNQKIRELLNLKIFKDVDDDYVRLSRLVLNEENFLKNNSQAYDIFFGIYEKYFKTSYDEYISAYKNVANIVLPDYEIDSNREMETDETLEFIISITTNLIKNKSK